MLCSGAEFFSSCFVRLAVLTILGMATTQVSATDIEPRSYSNIPVGLNFLLTGYTYMKGNVTFAPSVPITNGKLETHSGVLAYVRSLDIWGKSGKLDIIIPYAGISGQADVLGEPRSREIAGFADPLFRFYVNLYGAPALSMKEFASYKQDTIIGVSLAVTAPGRSIRPKQASKRRHQSLVHQARVRNFQGVGAIDRRVRGRGVRLYRQRPAIPGKHAGAGSDL